MDSYSSRANSIFCTFATVLGTASVASHLTTFLPQFQASPSATLSNPTVHDLTVNSYYKMDQCTLSFSTEMDFSSEVNWNMHQLFVYLVATYNDTSNKRNEVTVWDTIMTRSDPTIFNPDKPLVIKYPLRDQYRELRGKNVRLHLRYRTMPLTGLMYEKEVAVVDFKVPNDYFRQPEPSNGLPRTKRTKK
eukprot:TRINITY_DN225_c0_g2_i1.p1 TRINITY_DN225_c0_g2~~TRINITY_DN225_c0_g2_i1.p1  ORF type:complete len:190 (-),score=30.53 TRINITY_DN225_c0_g2_i1:59-628(-)